MTIKFSEEQYEKMADILFNVAYSAWVMNLKLYNADVFNDLHEPKIGDYVIETSNPFVPKLFSMGKLIDVSEDGWSYKIERLDGEIHNWENANFVKVADENTLKLLNR